MNPSPSTFRLPSKFTRFYPGQFEAVSSILTAQAGLSNEDEQRITVIDSRPGTGKTLMYNTVHQIRRLSSSRTIDNPSPPRTVILVVTTKLQEQLTRDFPYIADLRGQSHYTCNLSSPPHNIQYSSINPSSPPRVDSAPCQSGYKCPLRQSGCTYYDSVRAFIQSSIGVTNYSKWISTHRYNPNPQSIFGNVNYLILDEAHQALDQLTSHCTINLPRSLVLNTISHDPPPFTPNGPLQSDSPLVLNWLPGALTAARETWKDLSHQPLSTRTTRDLISIERLGRDLADLQKSFNPPTISDTPRDNCMDWTAETIDGDLSIIPVWPRENVARYLLRPPPYSNPISHITLSSATISPATLDHLSIPSSSVTWINVPYTHDKHQRPFINIPVTPIIAGGSRKTKPENLNKVFAIIDECITARRQPATSTSPATARHGIIQPVSYAQSKLILDNLTAHRDIIIHHQPGKYNLQSAINEYLNSPPPVILLSPVIYEGVDFPYWRCLYNIIWKVPFRYSKDPVTSARAATDKSYNYWLAARHIEQSAGRGNRASDDFCETFIFDALFSNVMANSYSQFFSPHFRASWKRIRALPPPPPLKGKCIHPSLRLKGPNS